jgi:predicted membrane chloride channel (bestrophin family)
MMYHTVPIHGIQCRTNSYSSLNPELKERRHWYEIFTSVRKTVIPHIMTRTIMFTLLSVTICAVETYGKHFLPDLSATGHKLIGVALGLLLVYRTNS